MTPVDLLTAYGTIADKHSLPPMVQAACKLERQEFSDSRQAWVALTSLAPEQGWLLYQSHVATFEQGHLPDSKSEWGALLAAETADARGRAVHLRQTSTGACCLITMTPRYDSDVGVDESYLVDEVRQLATNKAPGSRLSHRRFWRLDAEKGPTPIFAIFQGFDGKGEI